MKNVKKFKEFVNENLFKIPDEFNVGDYEININKPLTSLKGLPKNIRGSFDMDANILTSLNNPTDELIEYFDENDNLEGLQTKWIKNSADINYIVDNFNENDIDKYVDDNILEYSYLLNLLKYCSDKIKNKYNYLLDGNKFDLI